MEIPLPPRRSLELRKRYRTPRRRSVLTENDSRKRFHAGSPPPGILLQAGLEASLLQELAGVPAALEGNLRQKQAPAGAFRDQQPMPADLDSRRVDFLER